MCPASRPSRPAASTRRYGGKSAEERRTERRAALVAAARETWREQGWAAVTMRGVCARAGLTDRYFYESFRDREELLAAVWDVVRERTFATLVEAIAARASEDPDVQLRHVLERVLHEIADDPAEAQILFGDHAGSVLLEQRRRETIQQTCDLLIDLLRPRLRADVEETALRVGVLVGIGGFVEVVLAWRSGLIGVDVDTLVEHISAAADAVSPRFLA